jgi:hypothetical protein
MMHERYPRRRASLRRCMWRGPATVGRAQQSRPMADADFAQAGATNYCPISNLRKSGTGADQYACRGASDG